MQQENLQIPWRKVNIFSQELKVLQTSLFSCGCITADHAVSASQTGSTGPKLNFVTHQNHLAFWLETRKPASEYNCI